MCKYTTTNYSRFSTAVSEAATYLSYCINHHAGGEIWRQSLEATGKQLLRVLTDVPYAYQERLGTR